MMSFRRIAIAVAGGVVAVALLEIFLVPRLSTDARFWYSTVSRLVIYAIAAALAGRTASTFGWWSEYVGRAWTLFFVEFALLFINFILRRAAPDAVIAQDVSLVIPNIASIAAYWLIARSLRAAGLAYGSPVRKILVILMALALALLLCYSPLVIELRSILAGQVRPGRLISVLADIITFVMVAPLLMSTFALRGGQLVWLFAFLTIGILGWMVNQGSTAMAGFFGAGDDALRTLRVTSVAAACFFTTAAAMTQWLAGRRAMKGALAND